MIIPHRRRGSRVPRFWILAAVLCSLIALYLVVAAVVWMRKPTITFDPIARIQDASVKAEPGHDAWTDYKRGLKWTHAQFRDAASPEATAHKLAMEAIAGGPDALNWGAAAPALDAHREELETLRRACAMPALGFVPQLQHSPEDREYFGMTGAAPAAQGGDFPAASILLPHLSELRGASRVLRADALLEAGRGHGSQAVDSIAAMMGAARHASQVPVLIGGLVDVAIASSAANTAMAAIALRPDAFTEADLKRLDALMATVTPEYTRMKVEGERVMMDDALQRFFTDDGNGGGKVMASRVGVAFSDGSLYLQPPSTSGAGKIFGSGPLAFLAGPVLTSSVKDRAEVHRIWSGVIDEAEAQSVLPLWKQRFVMEPELEAARASQRFADFPASVVVPVMSRAVRLSAMSRLNATAARVHIALELFHRANNRWPATLDELVPAYLAAVPGDECADEPLHYRVVDGKPRVWSMGPNGHDDDGESDDLLFSR